MDSMAEKQKDLYLECSAGISGDMAVAALLDAGVDAEVLNAVLRSIPAAGFQTEIRRVSKGGVDCCDFNVILDAGHENHDHDMEYLFGHESGDGRHEHEHQHDYARHDHHHDHEHDGQHEHEHPGHHHEHRGLAEINAIIDATQMTEGAKALARKIFRILAESESKAHNVPVGQVHFHEVGAIDSIVDVIALAVCFDSLQVGKVYVPSLTEGRGSIRCQHGILPVPVPAVANIVSAYGIPLSLSGDRGEFVTPTGAAFVAAVRTDAGLPKSFVIRRTGMGAGKRAYERPNILRAFIIDSMEGNAAESGRHAADATAGGAADTADAGNTADTGDYIVKLETNIDDCTAEQLGFVSEELFKAGARDVSFIPCQMKKNRPGTLLNVICGGAQVRALEALIFRHTTTIGIRRVKYERTVLPREPFTVQTAWGGAQAKKVRLPDGELRVYPEYESAARIAREQDLPYGQVYREIERRGQEMLSGAAAGTL